MPMNLLDLLQRVFLFVCKNLLMGALRIFLLVLLSLAIPLQGYAGLVAPEIPCPMASSLAGHGTAMQAEAASEAADCCHDEDALAATGAACKAGQECKIGSFGVLYVPINALGAQAPRTLLTHFHGELFPELRLASIWRPPRHS